MYKKIAPSLLSADFTKIKQEVESVFDSGAQILHLDVMDGVFVPNISFGAKMVSDIRKITSLALDVHLMIERPSKYLQSFIDAGADYLSFHIETEKDKTIENLDYILSNNVKAGIVVSPDTDINMIECVLKKCALVTLMSVYPGFGGQKLLLNAFDRIKQLRSLIDSVNPCALLQVDGGITEQNASEIFDLGADILVAGNAFFKAQCRKSFVSFLQDSSNNKQ